MATREEERRKRNTRGGARPVVSGRQLIGAIPPTETPIISRRQRGASGPAIEQLDIDPNQNVGIASGSARRRAVVQPSETGPGLFQRILDARTNTPEDTARHRQMVSNAVESVLPAGGGGIGAFGKDLINSANTLGMRVLPSMFGGGGQNAITAPFAQAVGDTGPVRAATNIIGRATQPPQQSNQGNSPKEKNPASEPPVVIPGTRAATVEGELLPPGPDTGINYTRIGGDQYRATVPDVRGEAILSRAPRGGTFSVLQGRTADEQASIDQRVAQIDSQADALYRTRMARRGKRVPKAGAVTPETQQQLLIEREKGRQRRLVEQERAKGRSGDQTTVVTRQRKPEVTNDGMIALGPNLFEPEQYQQFTSGGPGFITLRDLDENVIGEVPTISQQALDAAEDPDTYEAARLDLIEQLGVADPSEADILAYIRRSIEDNIFTERQTTNISR